MMSGMSCGKSSDGSPGEEPLVAESDLRSVTTLFFGGGLWSAEHCFFFRSPRIGELLSRSMTTLETSQSGITIVLL